MSAPGKNPEDDSFREQVQKLFSGLNSEEMESLRAGLADIGKEKYPFSRLKKNAPLAVFLWLAMEQKEPAENEEAKLKECKHRDSLTGQAKVDYLVSQLTEDCCCYCPPFQRDVLKLIVNGEPSQSDWEATHDTKTYLVGTINRTFEGCSKSLRQKVVAQYLRDVMPALEVKYKQEKAEQEAYDNLMDYLSNKTTEEINALTKQLKRVGTGKGVSV